MVEPTADRSPAGRLLDLAFFAPLGLAVSVGEILPELARKGRARVEPQMDLARAVGQLAVGQGRRQLADRLPFGGTKPPFGGTKPPFGFPLPSFGFPLPKFEFPMGIKLPLKGFPLGPFAAYASRGRATSGVQVRQPAMPDTAPSASGGRVPADGRRAGPRPTSPAPAPTVSATAVERPVRPVVKRAADVETATGHVVPGRRTARPTASAAGPGPLGTGAAGDGPGRVPEAAHRAAHPRSPSGPQRGPGAATHLAIPSYDALSASQVVQRLAGLSRDEVRAVRAYEASTRGRRTILNRADQLLA